MNSFHFLFSLNTKALKCKVWFFPHVSLKGMKLICLLSFSLQTTTSLLGLWLSLSTKEKNSSASKAMQPTAGAADLLPAVSDTPEQQRGGCVCPWAQGNCEGGCCSCPCCHLLFLISVRCLTQPGMWGTAVPGNGGASQHLACNYLSY